MRWIHSLSWPLVVIVTLTLGLAPYKPEPHLLEKITMLFNGDLSKGIDIFDLFLHATPWILFILKTGTLFSSANKSEFNK